MDAEKLAMQRRIDTLDQHATRLHAALTEAERENARLKAELEIVMRELEEEKANHQHTLECAQQFEEDWLKMKRERDAAVKDMAVIKLCHTCKLDKNSVDESDICYSCVNKCYWEWRGLCESNGGKDGKETQSDR